MNIIKRLAVTALLAVTTTDAFTSPKSQNTRTCTSLSAKIAIAGATGRTGKYVVSKLLSQNIPVYALVRDTAKAAELFDPTNGLLTIRKTDLGSEEDVLNALEEEDCDAAIWCATGFSDAPDQSIWTKVRISSMCCLD